MSEFVCRTLKLLAESKGAFASAIKNIFNTRTMATLKISDLSVGDWVIGDELSEWREKRCVMSNYNNYAYAIVRCSMDKLVAALRLALGAFANFDWFAPRQQAQRLPQRRTIGKEHRGYAKSRIRTHQRKG